MKKLTLALIALILIFAVSCSPSNDSQQSSDNKEQVQTAQQAEKVAEEKSDVKQEQKQTKKSNRATPVVEAVQKSEYAVVNIRAEMFVKEKNPFFGDALNNDFLRDFFGYNKPQKNQSLGSGVLIDKNGTIITNFHVVKNAAKVTVKLSDEKTYNVDYLGGDEILDIAILKIRDAKLNIQPAITGNSDDIMLGETVIAMGNPYGLNSSITTGIISSKNRVINIGSGYALFMQTDALINPGNSGGPLVNLDGEVIGINTAIFKNAQGIGFSIPINTVLRIMPEILKKGKVRMGYMGFAVTEQTTTDGNKLIVSYVEPKSNAGQIGIMMGDQILQIADIPVYSLSALSYMLRSYPPGTSVPVVVLRGEKTLRGKIAISDYPAKFGIQVLENNYGIGFEQKGKFLVVSHSTNSRYFKEGDILIGINNAEVKNLKELDQTITDNLGELVLFSLYRDSKLISVQLQF